MTGITNQQMGLEARQEPPLVQPSAAPSKPHPLMLRIQQRLEAEERLKKQMEAEGIPWEAERSGDTGEEEEDRGQPRESTGAGGGETEGRISDGLPPRLSVISTGGGSREFYDGDGGGGGGGMAGGPSPGPWTPSSPFSGPWGGESPATTAHPTGGGSLGGPMSPLAAASPMAHHHEGLHFMPPILENPLGGARVGSSPYARDPSEVEEERRQLVEALLGRLGLTGREGEAATAAARIQAWVRRWLLRGWVGVHSGHTMRAALCLLHRHRHLASIKRRCGLDVSLLVEARNLCLQQRMYARTVRMASGRHSLEPTHAATEVLSSSSHVRRGGGAGGGLFDHRSTYVRAGHEQDSKPAAGGAGAGGEKPKKQEHKATRPTHSAHAPCMCELCRVTYPARADKFAPSAGALVRHMAAARLQSVWRGCALRTRRARGS